MWIKYIYQNWFEVTATIFGLLYIYYTIRKNIWLWFYGFIFPAMYVFIFYEKRLYADALLNLYYALISVYGFIAWLKAAKRTEEDFIRKLTKKDYIISGIFFLAVFIPFYLVVKFIPELLHINSASLPFIDSSLTALSILATWMLAERYIEQWVFWIFIDFAYTLVYLYKGLYATVFLFLVYTVMSVIGYINWRKILTSKNNI